MQENASDYGKLAELQRSLDEANENLLEKYLIKKKKDMNTYTVNNIPPLT